MTLTRYKIVETDNFGGDYPDEKFVNLPALPPAEAAELCSHINEIYNKLHGPTRDRYYKIVPENYVLIPGFEP